MAEKITVWGVSSTRAMRVYWTLIEFSLDYDMRPIGARTGETQTDEYGKLNPKRKIPVLQHGDITLSESAAIATYLAETFAPPADFFVPRTALERARVNEWCYFVMTELDAHTLYLLRRHEGLAHIYGAAPEACASARDYFLKQVNAIADAVEAAGNYLMGDKLSVADIIFVTCLDWAIAYGFALPQPLLDYHARVAARPSYRQAMRVCYPERSAENA